MKYEFVDLHQDGAPMGGGELDCNRKFVSSLMDRKDPAIFRSVRNVFLFGRGGTRNLKCIYKFEGMRGERVRIKLRKVTTMNRQCMSRVDEDINRSFCYGDTSVKVEVSTQRKEKSYGYGTCPSGSSLDVMQSSIRRADGRTERVTKQTLNNKID